MRRRTFLLGSAGLLVLRDSQPAPGEEPADTVTKLDPALPSYRRVEGVSGRLVSVGSSLVSNLLGRWHEEFKSIYPAVELDIQGGGSSTAPAALADGRAQLGPMSRPMRAAEAGAIEARRGARPAEFKVALDALAIFVNKDNPVTGLTLPQVDGIFSSTRALGGPAINTWGDLGLGGRWSRLPVTLYGYGPATGAYALFREAALGGGEFRSNVKLQAASSSVVQGPGADPSGIAYASIFFRTRRTRAIPLSAGGGVFYAPNQENAVDGRYPLARALYIYAVLGTGPSPETVREFLRFICSRPGQEIAARDGNFPLPTAQLGPQLEMLRR